MTPWPSAPGGREPRPPFGQYLGPFETIPLRAPRFRLKHWHYLSLHADDHFLALGLVQLGYVAQLFAYLIDTQRGTRRALEQLSPLGRALSMAVSPKRPGRSCWRSRDARVAIDTESGWQLSLDLPLVANAAGARTATRLHGQVELPWGAGLSLLFDLGGNRSAYTYKVADIPAHATLSLDGRPLSLERARATVDWTYAHARRHTRWRWASATGRTDDGTRIGLNLSSHVYDKGGVSQENVLWLDERPRSLGAVTFEIPTDPSQQPWTLRTHDDDVQLRFVPQGARRDAHNFGVVKSRFVQAYGRFTGNVQGRAVENLYGVMEDHDAVW